MERAPPTAVTVFLKVRRLVEAGGEKGGEWVSETVK